MCIFSAVFRRHPRCPLFVLANRDEARWRSTAPPQRTADAPGAVWVGGLDLLGGGTWLGVNAHGLMAAVTNRPKSHVAADVRSRGLLCRDLLTQPSVEAARAELDRQRQTHEFAGFNLLLFSATEGMVFEAGDDPRWQVLSPGIHTIANRDFNDDTDPRVVRARGEVEALVRESDELDQWVAGASRIVGLHADGDAHPLCLHRNGWGTVSSTILALTDDPAAARYHYAAGPPCTTPFGDHSTLLRSVLAEGLRHEPGLKTPRPGDEAPDTVESS